MKRHGIELVFEASGASAAEIEAAETAAWVVFENAEIDPWVAAAAAFKQEGEIDDVSPEEEDAAEVWRDALEQAKRAIYRDLSDAPFDTDLRLIRQLTEVSAEN